MNTKTYAKTERQSSNKRGRNMKTYTAAYARVSSPRHLKRQSTESQVLALKKYIKEHHLKGVKWFEDYSTGRKIKRDSLNQIIDDCRQGKCSQIIMYKLDRLSRNCRQTLELVEELVGLGVKIVCISQGFSFDDSPMGRFTLQIFSAVAELESNHISERVKAGLDVAKAKGTKLGGKPDTRKRNRIKKLVSQGYSTGEIAEKLGVSPAAISQMKKRIAA